jgi:hypothetical protein
VDEVEEGVGWRWRLVLLQQGLHVRAAAVDSGQVGVYGGGGAGAKDGERDLRSASAAGGAGCDAVFALVVVALAEAGWFVGAVGTCASAAASRGAGGERAAVGRC